MLPAELLRVFVSMLTSQPEALRSFVDRASLLSPTLAGRDPLERFGLPEKAELAGLVKEAWREIRFNRAEAPVVLLRDATFQWGSYPDGEAFVLSTSDGRRLVEDLGGRDVYTVVNLETERDVVAARTILQRLGPGAVVVGSMYFPYQRGDRPEFRADHPELQELLVLETLVEDMTRSGVRGMVVCDSHSPAFSWFGLKHEMAVLDVSAIPGMLAEASRLHFLEGERLIVVGGDDGAREMTLLVQDILGCKDVIQGEKTKVGGRTNVVFSPEDLAKVRGVIAVLPEDIISTGKTMAAVCSNLIDAGAERVVILATYPIFAGEAVDLFGSDDRVKIITTDGRTPLHDIRRSENIVQIPVQQRLYDLLLLDQQRVDFWSEEGRQELASLGLCLAPWQIYD